MRENFGFDFFSFRYGKAKIWIDAETFEVIRASGDTSEWDKLDYDEQHEIKVEQFDIKFESMFE